MPHILTHPLINDMTLENNMEYRRYFLVLSAPLSVTFHILRNTERNIVNKFWPSCIITVTLAILKKNFNFPFIEFHRIMKN